MMRKAVPLTAILTAVTISLTSCALFSGRPTAGGEQDKEYRDYSSHTETPQGGTRMKYQGFIWGGLYVEDVERAILREFMDANAVLAQHDMSRCS
jgi:hypothetical protein